MVLLVMKWDIHPDKVEAYMKWTEDEERGVSQVERRENAALPSVIRPASRLNTCQ